MYFLESPGGLGNQLFIWNLAHHLTIEQKKKVVILFPGKFKDRENHLAELKQYCNHDIAIIDKTIVGFLVRIKDKLSNRSDFLRRRLNGLFRILELAQPEQIASEENLKKALLIRGFHQSSELVVNNFDSFFEELKQIVETKYEKLIEKESIKEFHGEENIMHIRRGDYKLASNIIGVLSLQYYIEIIRAERWSRAVIVSDSNLEELGDLVDLQENHDIEIIKVDGLSAWEDFSILCQGKNLIIANSTFSWWAAQYVIKMKGNVFAPKPWNVTALFTENYLHDSRFLYRESTFSSRVK